jgi:proteasome lid subunit RPN8/RPN11
MARIPRAILDEMIAHAREDPANEACGIVHARDGVPIAVHRLRNVGGEGRQPSPFRYLMDPLQFMRLEQQRDATGETLFAMYHSHIQSEARPSRTDERQAFFPPATNPEDYDREPAYPGIYYILVSLTQEPTIRAWRVSRRSDPTSDRPQVDEEAIEVV